MDIQSAKVQPSLWDGSPFFGLTDAKAPAYYHHVPSGQFISSVRSDVSDAN
jgi:hypothetical protein